MAYLLWFIYDSICVLAMEEPYWSYHCPMHGTLYEASQNTEQYKMEK